MKLEIYQDGSDPCWRWRVTSESGRLVAIGTELYDSPATVERAIHRVAEVFQGGYQIARVDATDPGTRA